MDCINRILAINLLNLYKQAQIVHSFETGGSFHFLLSLKFILYSIVNGCNQLKLERLNFGRSGKVLQK